MQNKFIIYFLLMAVSISMVSALGVGGNSLTINMDYEPGAVKEYSFFIANNDGYVSNYKLVAEMFKGSVDLTPYVTITPTEYSNVPSGETRSFKVKFEMPAKLDSPGQNEFRVWVKSVPPEGQPGLTARPAVGVRFIVFVLYPWKTISWDYSTPILNINDTGDFNVHIENQGEPVIKTTYADIKVYNSESTDPVRTLRTNTKTNLQPKESDVLKATLDTTGLLPGEYSAVTTLHWDNNVSSKNKTFKIGEKHVSLLNFTRLFEINAINKFELFVESQWNDKLNKVYATVDIYDRNDKDRKTKLASFKSFDTDMKRLQKKTLEAYFDTNGLEKKEYLAVIHLFYDGAESIEEGYIKVDENINAKTVDEIPGKFSFSNLIPKKITALNVLTLLLVIFVLVNIYLVYHTLVKKRSKGRKEKEEEEEPIDIDEAIVNHVKELKKKYKDDYIKEMMIKKGWSKKKIEEIFKRL